MDWNDLRHFLALARLGSIRAAGAELGVSHTTVARRVEALEEELGARLFDRHRDGYVLTDAGRRLLPSAARVEDEVCALARDLAGQDARLEGPVRVTCGDEYLAGLLLSDLAPWCAANPGVDLTFITDARAYNLAKGEADIAVRVLPRDATPPEYLVGQRVAPLVCATYVARAHAAALDPTREPPGPATRWLGFTDPRAQDAVVGTSSYPRLPVWGAFSTLSLLVRATREGLGFSVLPTYVGDPDPTLQRLAPACDLRQFGDVWILHHPDLKANVRVQGARAALRAGIARRRALFEGRHADAPERSGDAP